MNVREQRHLILGDRAPNFQATSSLGSIDLYEYLGDSWGILFSHPKDHTPVCTTELGRVAQLKDEWAKRNVKVVGLSCDSASNHKSWIDDINEISGTDVFFPLIADEDRAVACMYGMLDQNWLEANMPLTVRSVFIISPAKEVKLIMTYPASTGRNFDEILRVVDSLQLTANKKVATPADWKKSQDVVVLPGVTDDEATRLFGTFNKVKSYLRTTADPSDT